MLDYLFIGPQKTGSTFLYEYFKKNSQTTVSEKVKEINFFSENFSRGHEWYYAHFDSDANKVTMDFEPKVFGNIKSIDNVKRFEGVNKIYVILRDPATRVKSLYNHWVRYGIFQNDLEYHIVNNDKNILSSSLYAEGIKRLYEYFGKDRVALVYYEDLFEDVEKSLKSICDDIGIKYEYDDVIQVKVNAASKPKSRILAKVATYSTSKLKAWGLYSIVNFLKFIGLRSIVYGADGQSETIVSNEDLVTIKKFIGSDLEEMKQMGLYHKNWINL